MGEIVLGTLDLSELKEQIDPAAIRRRISEVAALARSEWVRLAKQRFRSTAADYIAGIAIEERENSSVIRLTGRLPNMLEQGWPRTDLRDTMLKAGKRGVERSKTGHLYRSIMFRRSMGGMTGWPISQPASYQRGLQRRLKSIRKAAQALQPTRRTKGSDGRYKGAFGGSTGRVDAKARRRHTNQLYERTYKFQEVGRKKHNFYGGFRTLSTNPATFRGNNWIHPGFKPARLARDVTMYVRLVAVPQVFQRGQG